MPRSRRSRSLLLRRTLVLGRAGQELGHPVCEHHAPGGARVVRSPGERRVSRIVENERHELRRRELGPELVEAHRILCLADRGPKASSTAILSEAEEPTNDAVASVVDEANR